MYQRRKIQKEKKQTNKQIKTTITSTKTEMSII